MAWPARVAGASLPPGSRVGPRWGAAALQNRTAVGLDLGGGSLKLVQVSWGRQGARLETFAWIPLAAGTLDEGVVLHPGEVALLLRTALQELGVRQRHIFACVGGPGLMMRPVFLPAVPDAELREAMRFEAPQYLPIPEDHLVYDFAPVPEMEETPEGQVAVFLAGTQRRLVDSHVAACEQAGVHLHALDLDCLCALRALGATGRVGPGHREGLVLLDCGETGLGLTVFRYGAPVLTRTIPGGMAELRAAVADGLGVGKPEAQARIWSEGLAHGGPLGPYAENWLRNAAEAVGRSVEFFMIQNRGAGVQRLFLYGPWAAVPRLAQELQMLLLDLIGQRLEGADPFRVQVADLAGFPAVPGVEEAANAAGPALLTALGAALRGVPDR